MTKAELVKQLSQKTGFDRQTVETIVEAFMLSVKEHLSNKESVSLNGFGNFIPKKRAAKVARLISKNTIIQLPAHFVPVFKPSKSFITKVKNSVK
jgi:DNA-binding protein HU-beta